MIKINKILLTDILKNPKNYNSNNHGNKVDNYYEYINKFDTNNWIDKFHKYEKIVIKEVKILSDILKLYNINNKFPKLYSEDLDDIVKKYSEKYKNIKINNKFVRTNKTSLKTGCYGIGPYNSLNDILLSTVTTRYGHHALNGNEKELNIYLMNFIKIDINKEFRVFVVNNKISCISQQNIYQKSDFLLNHSNLNKLILDLNLYFEKNIKLKLIEYENYVMDIALNELNEFFFIEINPFGKEYTSGSACFHWINDDKTINDNSFIEFRYVV